MGIAGFKGFKGFKGIGARERAAGARPSAALALGVRVSRGAKDRYARFAFVG